MVNFWAIWHWWQGRWRMVMMRKMKVEGDEEEDEGGRWWQGRWRWTWWSSGIQESFGMWLHVMPASPPLSSAAKIEQETSETGETGGIETGHNSETTKMLPITIFLKWHQWVKPKRSAKPVNEKQAQPEWTRQAKSVNKINQWSKWNQWNQKKKWKQWRKQVNYTAVQRHILFFQFWKLYEITIFTIFKNYMKSPWLNRYGRW